MSPRRRGWALNPRSLSMPRPTRKAFVSATIKAALDGISGLRALVVGDAILDAYLYGETSRVSREAPVVVVERRSMEYRLGGAANTATNLAALGATTTILCTVGADQHGTLVESQLRAAGVVPVILRPPHGCTAVKTRVLAGAPGTTKQQMLRIDDSPSSSYPEPLYHELIEHAARLATSADMIIVSDYGLGVVSDTLAATLRGSPARCVCADSRYQLLALGGLTAVTPNVPEAEAATGIRLDDDHAIERAGRVLLEKLRCPVLLTLGRGGMRLFRPDRASVHVDIVGDHEVTDVTGAGDTVIAAFAAAVASGIGMVNAMCFANVAAGIVVNKVGCSTAMPSEILETMHRFDVGLEPWDRSSS